MNGGMGEIEVGGKELKIIKKIMIFIDKEQEEKAVSQAWNLLYQRLERDGLLTDEAVYSPPRRFVSVIGKIAVAAIIITCIFSGWYFLRKTNLPEMTMQVLTNEAHAPLLATMLEDGSVVYLSEQTSLQYPDRFDENIREVILQGEAFFDVKKQIERPFIIHTNIVRVEVTGTSFKIKSDRNDSFLLSVREGEVRVTEKNRHQGLTVKAGETVFFDSEQILLRKSDADCDEYFKCIHFKDEYLTDVATIINIHLDSLRLKVDPSIENRITFTFMVDSNIAETVEAICLALNLHYLQQDNTIYISNPK